MAPSFLKFLIFAAISLRVFAFGPPKSINTIFQFPESLPFSWAENLVIRPDGTFLITRLDVPEVWSVNPFSGEASLVFTFPNATVLLGIAEYKPSVYGIAVGNFSLDPIGGVPGSWSVWSLDLTKATPKGKEIAAIPEATFLNGLIAVEPNVHGKRNGDDKVKPTLLIADTALGVVYSVDTSNGKYNNFTEPSFLPPSPPTPGGPGGLNGLKYKNSFLYFTNSDLGLFARLPISIAGGTKVTPSGPVETLTTRSRFLDDFTILDDGVAYLTTDPDNSVVKYEPGKGFTTIAGGLNQTIVAGATACLFGRTEKDRDVLYVTTSGAHGGPVNGTFTEPAKIVAIQF